MLSLFKFYKSMSLGRGSIVFYDRLKSACAARGTTPTTLCKKLSISTAHTGPWSKGGKPGAIIMEKITTELRCSAAYLLELSDEMEINAPTKVGAFTREDMPRVSVQLGLTKEGDEFSEKDGDLLFGILSTFRDHMKRAHEK